MDAQDKEARKAAKKAKREARWLKRYRRGRRIAPFGTGLVFSGCIVLAATIAAPLGVALLLIAAACAVLSLANSLRTRPSRRLELASFVLPGLALTILPWVLLAGIWGYLAGGAGLLLVLCMLRNSLTRLPDLPARAHPVRPFRVALGILVGLAVGSGFTLFMFLDEPARSFPQLERFRSEPASEENGWELFRHFRGDPRWSERGRADVSDVFDAVRDAPEEWPPALVGRINDMLGRWAEPLAAVDEALARPHFVTAPPSTRQEAMYGADDPWDDLQRTISGLLELRSELAEREGRGDDAAADAGRLIKMGALILPDARDLMDYYVGLGWLAGGTGRARELAGKEGGEELARMMAALPEESVFRSGITSALSGEYASARVAADRMADLSSLADERLDWTPYSQTRMALLVRRPAQQFFKPNATTNAVGTACMVVLGSLGSYESAAEAQAAQEKRHDAVCSEGLGGFRNLLGRMVLLCHLPGPHVAELYFGEMARLRLTRVTLALAQYRLARGNPPETLDALAPEYLDEVPVDPFTEEPFIYEPGGDPPRVLSVGPDQQLDVEAEEEDDRDDIVLELTFTATASVTHGERQLPQHDDTTATTNDLAAADDGA